MDRWFPWALRLVWVGVAVAGSAAIDDAVIGRSDAVRVVATWGAAAGWIAGVVAMAVPAVASLTATRVVIPVGVGVALVAAVAGTTVLAGALFVALAGAAALLAGSAELGRAFVQASAYGDESRFPLRPPIGFALVAALAWCLWAAAIVAGPLLLAARSWIAGAVVTVLAVAATWMLARRWHLLSRRWLVLVPAGLVVHDPVVLGETLMLRRTEIAEIGLAPADTEALDLTGPASGHAVEVRTVGTVTALFPPDRERPTGRAVHLRAFLVAPSRPGRFLTDAAARRLPVG
ncbi:MAG: hypothetical protein WD225_11180 [Ilumatobacteraceae bacterium]